MIFILGITTIFLAFHPSQLSMTNFDVKGNTVLVAHMFYLEDLNEIYNDNHMPVFDIDVSMPDKNLENIKKYVKDRFKISILDNHVLSSEFIKSEISETTLTLHYCYKFGNNVTQLTVTNSFFTEFYTQQKNLMVIKIDGQEKGYIFNKNYTTQVLNIP